MRSRLNDLVLELLWLLLCREPGRVRNLKTEVGMKTAVVSWSLPTVGARQAALAVSLVMLSADGGANFAELERVAAPSSTLRIPDLDDGGYVVRVSAIDVAGREGEPATLSFSVSSTTPVPEVPPDPPGAVTGLSVSLE